MKSSRFPALIALFSLAGAVLSVISLYQHIRGRYSDSPEASFCNINAAFNCDAVNESSWSVIFGVPLASYGLAFYFCMFLYSLFAADARVIARESFRSVVLLLFTFAGLFSVFLFYISEFVIGTICIVCVGMYLANFASFFTALFQRESLPFGSALVHGFKSLLSVPVIFFGRDNNNRSGNSVRFGVLLGAIVIFISYSLGDFILIRYVDGKPQDSGSLVSADREMVEQWIGTPAASLQLSIHNGALTRDFYEGPETAPVEIVEFSDFECPACGIIFQVLKDLMAAYPGKIRLVYKNFPLDSSCNAGIKGKAHESACYLAYFARCAGEQDRFWEAAEFAFGISSAVKRTGLQGVRAELDTGMKILQLDQDAMHECLDSGRHRSKIISDVQEANSLEVNATPTLWINGKRVPSIKPAVLQSIIDSILHDEGN